MEKINVDEFYVQTRTQFKCKQKLWYLSLCLFGFYAPFHLVQIIFIGRIPKFNCTIKGIEYNDTCGGRKQKLDCDTVKYTASYDSLLRRFPSDCPADSTAAQTLQLCFTFGLFVGALVCGRIADKIGRKKVLGGTLAVLIVAGTIESFPPAVAFHAVFRFICGFCAVGNMNAGFVLAGELVGPRIRGRGGIVFQAFFSIGIPVLSGLAYLLQKDYRFISMTCGLIGLPLFLVVFWVPESPHWYCSCGKFKLAGAVLVRMAGAQTLSNFLDVQNKNKEEVGSIEVVSPTQSPIDSAGEPHTIPVNPAVPSSSALVPAKISEHSKPPSSPGADRPLSRKEEISSRVSLLNRQVTMCQMLKKKYCLILILLLSWFTNSIVYYALTLTSGNLTSNFYVAPALSGLAELPAAVIIIVIIDCQRVGRRVPLVIFMVVAGLCCIIQQFLSNDMAKLAVSLFGKMCIAGSFSIIFIHTAELIPTSVRIGLFGVSSGSARIGGMVASFFVGVNTKTHIWPMMLLGSLSIFSGLINIMLPETSGRKLPETMEDINKNLGPCKIRH